MYTNWEDILKDIDELRKEKRLSILKACRRKKICYATYFNWQRRKKTARRNSGRKRGH